MKKCGLNAVQEKEAEKSAPGQYIEIPLCVHVVAETRPPVFSCELESPETTPCHSPREELTTLVVSRAAV